MSLILIIFGLFVFWKLPVKLPAGIQPPVVQVQVDYSSALSIVDQEVTQVIEDVIGRRRDKNIDSKSQNGRSTINVEFDTSIDLDNAANDIRKVARVVDNLPSESDPPQILKRAAGFLQQCGLLFL